MQVQQKDDPNGIDVRVEPKFTIPDGNPYTGGWCRPQTDGPALRAMALSKSDLESDFSSNMDVRSQLTFLFCRWGMLMVGKNRKAEALAEVLKRRNVLSSR